MRRAETSPRLAGLGVLLLVLGIGGVAPTPAGPKDAKEERALAVLPREVRDALDRAADRYTQPLKGARWSKAHALRPSDHPLYQLQGTNGRGNRIEMEVTSAGRIIEVEEHGIPLHEVPRAVIEALKARMPKFEPKRVEAIYQAEPDRPVSYGFEGKDADGRPIEVYVSADGKTFLN